MSGAHLPPNRSAGPVDPQITSLGHDHGRQGLFLVVGWTFGGHWTESERGPPAIIVLRARLGCLVGSLVSPTRARVRPSSKARSSRQLARGVIIERSNQPDRVL